MTETQEAPAEFVGYRDAAEYLGLARNTLSSYVSRGIGPKEKLDESGEPERRRDGQYLLPVFERAELDRWKEDRPGQGARTDLVSAEAEA
jgi:predicted transcriptional regulator of viral defense system